MRVRRRRAAAAPRPPPARCLAASRALFPGPPARLEPGFRRERVPRQAKSRLPADRGGAQGFLGGGEGGDLHAASKRTVADHNPDTGSVSFTNTRTDKKSFFFGQKMTDFIRIESDLMRTVLRLDEATLSKRGS